MMLWKGDRIIMSESKLGDGQKQALELGKLFDSICRKYNISYSLIEDTLWGATRYRGFTPWDHTMRFVMFHEDYNRFLEVCEKELQEGLYYIVNENKLNDFKELGSILAKRSKVKLPPERKKDEIYYDYTIYITPLFNSSTTRQEYLKHMRKHFKYVEVLSTRHLVKEAFKIRNISKRLIHTYWADKDKEVIFNKLKENSCKYNKKGEFVLLPMGTGIHKGVVCLSKTYRELQEVEFENHKFYCIVNQEQWLKDYYGESYMKNKKNDEVNQSSIMGPEIQRRVQLIELEMLIELDRICRKHNIKYALFAGTLLGAVRHKGFIPWDDDIDVCMLKKDYDKFLKVAKEELDEKKYFLRTQDTDVDCNLTFAQIKRNGTRYHRKSRHEFNTHLGVFIDIFPLYNGTNNWLLHKFQSTVCAFTKTMLWAHMGAITERRRGYRTYYRLLSRVSNKTSYKIYLKFATMFKDNNSKRISYLSYVRTPFLTASAMRETYTDLVEIEFEGNMFYAPRKYREYLGNTYSKDYLMLPNFNERKAKHIPAIIDVGDMYPL